MNKAEAVVGWVRYQQTIEGSKPNLSDQSALVSCPRPRNQRNLNNDLQLPVFGSNM